MATLFGDGYGKVVTAGAEANNKVVIPGPHLEKISNEVGRKIGAKTADFANTASDYVKKGHGYMRENPVKGAAVAAAAGLITGGLLTMALRRKH